MQQRILNIQRKHEVKGRPTEEKVWRLPRCTSETLEASLAKDVNDFISGSCRLRVSR